MLSSFIYTKFEVFFCVPNRFQKLLSLLFLFLFVSIIAPTAKSSVNNGNQFDVDFLSCGNLACALVYQGEGVSHPQLIVQIWRSGASLNTPVYEFIYDFPEQATPSFSMYISGHLAHRTGPSPVQLSEADILTMIPDGLLLAVGIEKAFNGPQTHHLNMWPSNSELDNIVTESAENIPQALIEWDENNLDTPIGQNPVQPTPIPWTDNNELTICQVKEDLDGVIVEDCIDEPKPPETSIEPGAEDFLVCEITEDLDGVQHRNCGDDIDKSGTKNIVKAVPAICYEGVAKETKSKTLICDKNYKKPLPKNIREEFTALIDCRSSRQQAHCPSLKKLDQIEDGRRLLKERLAHDLDFDRDILGSKTLNANPWDASTEEYLACHPQELLGYPDIGLCKSRCNQCDLMWLSINGAQAANTCALIATGGVTALAGLAEKVALEAASKFAVTPQGLGLLTVAAGACFSHFMQAQSAMRAAKLDACNWWCDNCLEGGNVQCIY